MLAFRAGSGFTPISSRLTAQALSRQGERPFSTKNCFTSVDPQALIESIPRSPPQQIAPEIPAEADRLPFMHFRADLDRHREALIRQRLAKEALTPNPKLDPPPMGDCSM